MFGIKKLLRFAEAQMKAATIIDTYSNFIPDITVKLVERWNNRYCFKVESDEYDIFAVFNLEQLAEMTSYLDGVYHTIQHFKDKKTNTPCDCNVKNVKKK